MVGCVATSVPHESNRIELSQIRIRFDRITNQIWTIRIRFELDSIRFEFRDYHLILHKFPKKEIFVFAKIEKLHYTRSHKFPKKKICFADHLASDLIQIRFTDHESKSNSNQIWIWIWIWFDSTNRLQNPTFRYDGSLRM